MAGGAYRWAGSAWNQQVATPYRDERAVTAAADVVITGATSNGYGVAGDVAARYRNAALSIGFWH